MFGDEHRRRQHVVVDEDDALAARLRDPPRCARGEPRVGWWITVKRAASRAAAALDDLRRLVGRAVVDEHDFVGVAGTV
jgi:hypothetical protein